MENKNEDVNPQSESLALLKQALSDPKVDADKLGQLLDVQERWEANEALKLFNKAMHAAQCDMPVVVKDAANKLIGNRYARLETVAKAIKPIYMKHGFSLSFSEEPCDRPDYLIIVGTVRHIGNHVEKYRRYAPIDDKGPKGGDVKTKLHGCQSTVSYIQRNLLCSIFGVTVADDDNDGNKEPDPPKTISENQVDQIETYIGNLPKGTREKILELVKVESISQITEAWFGVVIAKLKASLKKQEGES